MLSSRSKTLRRVFVLLVLMVASTFFAFHHLNSNSSLASPEASKFHYLPSADLPNLYRVHDSVFSGGQPNGDAGFQQLATLGVRTVISVDGAKPDVDTAKQFGLKYIHLPNGYEGIDYRQAVQLAKAVQTSEGPVFIHCHHGKHRSPAAASIACIGLGLIESENAIGFLEKAGTSSRYQGLYRSVAEAKPISPRTLKETLVDFRSTAPSTPMVESMVSIHEHFESLSKIIAQDVIERNDFPMPEASHQALMLAEQFREMLRQGEQAERSDEKFAKLTEQSRQKAQQLSELLLANSKSKTPALPAKAIELVRQLKLNCRRCHQAFRD